MNVQPEVHFPAEWITWERHVKGRVCRVRDFFKMWSYYIYGYERKLMIVERYSQILVFGFGVTIRELVENRLFTLVVMRVVAYILTLMSDCLQYTVCILYSFCQFSLIYG